MENLAYVYELSRDTWHGFTRPKGEPVHLLTSEDRKTLDNHGCGTFWALDSKGLKMELWACELTLRVGA
jgi:hypothetical protein